MSDFIIRPYRLADQSAVRTIAAETAFFGEPVERFLEDRELFCDAMYYYYTNIEPHYSWVACRNQRVIGFVMGSIDPVAYRRSWWRRMVPRLGGRLLAGRYQIGPLTRRYLFATVLARLNDSIPHADEARYPAHLHINVRADARGLGCGRRLMQAYLTQLKQLRLPGVHLKTTSLNVAACHLYNSLGFQLLDARPTRIWAHLVQEPVENRCYGLQLETFSNGAGLSDE